jgi:hypothetical protein
MVGFLLRSRTESRQEKAADETAGGATGSISPARASAVTSRFILRALAYGLSRTYAAATRRR